MKQLLTLSLLMIGASTLNAQALKRDRKPMKGYEIFREQMIAKAQRGSAHAPQKPTTMMQRVTAECGYDVVGTAITKSDTTYFRYSNGRSSVFNYDETYHDYYFPGDTDPAIDTFAYGHIKVNADTARYFSFDTTAHLEEELYAQYTAANKLSLYNIKRVSNGLNQRVLNYYDGLGRLVTLYGFDYNNATQQWDSAYLRRIDYNAQDEVTADTLFVNSQGDWLPAQVGIYTYTGGQFTSALVRMDQSLSGTFADIYQTHFSYYPNNDLKTVLVDVNLGGAGLAPYELDSMAWEPGGKYRTYQEIRTYNATAGAWDSYSLTLRNVNAGGLPDTTWYLAPAPTPGTYNLSAFMHTSYNSYDNPTQMEIYNLTGSTYEDVYHYFFYYQNFDPASVKATEALESMTAYPNPAVNTLNLKWKADGKPVQIAMVNAAGQMVYSETVTRVHGTESFDISHLTPGIYWLTVTNNKGERVFKTSVLKQ